MDKGSRPIPLFLSPVSCGFPSPAQDYIESTLDLNELLISKPAATFFVRARGDSMIEAGIFDGDLLIIDRSITARHGHVVLAAVYGEFTLKRYVVQRSGAVELIPENPKYKPIPIGPATEFQIWGVATHCVHRL
ncbi:MAG TPA: translesion error-prone DNA polymerase V autoproteolytic subunit [Bdellovibrionota bacterium]|jgi:DNA polymerase V|nr:translesion error-prone DNA polymerase V autoproteolytic subunit [Bdellovibrionota bacterium]